MIERTVLRGRGCLDREQGSKGRGVVGRLRVKVNNTRIGDRFKVVHRSVDGIGGRDMSKLLDSDNARGNGRHTPGKGLGVGRWPGLRGRCGTRDVSRAVRGQKLLHECLQKLGATVLGSESGEATFITGDAVDVRGVD
jgi:hypothetical protein